MDIQQTLAIRESTHGDFEANANFVHQLTGVFYNSDRYHQLTNVQQEALEMLARKLARILTGNPKLLDSWRDCVGYLQLAVNNMAETPGTLDVTNTKVVLNDDLVWVEAK